MLVNSESRFKKGDIIAIKNILVEEIICEYIEEDATSYTVKTPFAMAMSQGGAGFAQGLQAPAVRLPRTEQFTGQQRIYVTEYDISNTQEKVKVTEDVSIVK